jgi:hypothetical protein
VHKGADVKVGDNRTQQVIGTCKFFFYIGTSKFEADMVVVKGWSHDLLLSVEWLRRNEAGGTCLAKQSLGL